MHVARRPVLRLSVCLSGWSQRCLCSQRFETDIKQTVLQGVIWMTNKPATVEI
jgi:hypothetical protein